MHLSQNALTVLRRRYLRKKGSTYETPEELFSRVAKDIASCEELPKKKKEELIESYTNMMANLEFLPNTPTLVNAGTGNGCAYCACYVLGIEDSLDDIFSTYRKAALIQKAGGGVGMDWSNIRPRDTVIKSTGYKTRGVVQFIKIYADAMSVVDQGGIRPSANMGILSIHHPDILEFINMKHSGAAQNMNISVAVTDEFMKARDEGKKYNLYFPVYGNREKAGELDAKEIWDKIVSMAWRIGDPGIVWIDRVNRDNPTPSLGAIKSPNPCIVGDTLIAVADGRNAVSIKQLTEEGKDVPVYSRNLRTGQVEIKWGRNPRKTGEKKEVWKLTLDDDSTVIATPDHRLPLMDGNEKMIKDLLLNDRPFAFVGNQYKYGYTREIKSIEFHGYEDVYNLTVDDNHTYHVINSSIGGELGGICVRNCGESFLLSGESCCLGSINLVAILKKKVDSEGVVIYEWDYEKLNKLIPLAVRFLDGILDVSPQPLQEIKDAMLKTRKIGLGVMGFADALIKMRIQYNSMQGLEQAEHIMGYINTRAIEASIELGKEKGVFPAWELDKVGEARRNAIVTTIAPTGSIALIAGVSSGIEPLYAVAYNRMAFGDKKLSELHADFDEEIRRRNLNIPDLFDVIFNEHSGSVQKMNIPEDIKHIFVTAHDIAPEWHVRMQASFQKYVGNSISKTINMKKDATIEDIDAAYRLSYKLGCKGVTIYRDGSKGTQVLTSGQQTKPVEQNGGFGPRVRIEAPLGRTYEIPFGFGDALITVNEDDIGLCEVIVKAGRSGSPIAAEAESLGRLISLLMRCGVSTKYITKQLRGISAGETAFYKGGRTITSLSDAICVAIETHVGAKENKNKVIQNKDKHDSAITYKQACPECGGVILHQSKCVECPACGWGRCK